MQATENEQLRQQISELESQQNLDRQLWQMELESVRTGNQFKEAKLQAAEKRVDELMQEVKRLACSEEALKRRCRENDDTVQQIVANAENHDRRIAEDVTKLKSKIRTQAEALQDNARILQEKALQEVKLRDIISDLDEQLNKAKVEAEAARKLVSEMQQRQSSRFFSHRTRLGEADKFDLETQNYLTLLKAEVVRFRTQLQEVIVERDRLAVATEQLQARFQEELQRSARLDRCLKLRLDREREMETELIQTRHQLRQAEQAIHLYRARLQMEESRTAGN